MTNSLVLELHQLEVQLVPDEQLRLMGQPAKRRAARFASAQDRDAFVAGRLALQQFAAALLDVKPHQLLPDYRCPLCGPGQDHGRPGFTLDGGPAPIALSASRASGWVLLAGVVHPQGGLRLGVDLEATDRAAFAGFDDVVLTRNEKRYLASTPETLRDEQRTRLWARKEAWLKMTGEGLRRDPSDLDVLGRHGVQDLDTVGGRALPEGLVAALAVG
ncbi:4'-phosphopantetheinyl transferase superfamily protein [Paenarthrobacter nitroguajacolicus]|uniref:4'-phosphopantetheinyl transferase family protein n=1 Tax=Paenarthrobacter nitroguajacolicus TaxID=211146 RepID=UPI00285E7F87|nr:4'-phosphopantetheinyl transferase superfamily protein [Paenarthrobacter nitroguajacolicus]MDR6637852.1 4'-phosphopantetheinyl transferase [Paenarthrobacter nitroguajacolicus]